jgi:hypothetical protein
MTETRIQYSEVFIERRTKTTITSIETSRGITPIKAFSVDLQRTRLVMR